MTTESNPKYEIKNLRLATRRHFFGQCGVGVGAIALGATEVSASGADEFQSVVVPTIANDHQFNLDYTVAHVAALLDAINPDAIIVDDYTDWLRRNCPWNAYYPEIHVALEFGRAHSIPVFGRSDAPQATLETTARNLERYNARYSDVSIVATEVRAVLDRNSARIAREYSFNSNKTDLSYLLSHVLPERRKSWSEQRRQSHDEQCRRRANQIAGVIQVNPAYKRWAVLQFWEQAARVEELLGDALSANFRPIGEYLPLSADAIEARMDFKHIAWILSGQLDEWYGMWAPQVLNGARLRHLMTRLQDLAPDDPVSAFLEARWYLLMRDFNRAEPILVRLSSILDDRKFPFPINGKWIRPPWKSVRDKAKLNLAFVYDCRGKREQALAIYRDFLEKADALSDEARAVGYVFDDIRAAIQSYVDRPYSGMPEEAFRHMLEVARPPICDTHE
jgi:hypothetical protein